MIPWMSTDEEGAALRTAAARGGCRIVASGVRPTATGPRVVGSVVCPDGWAAARMLLAAAVEDARTGAARDLALEIRASTDGTDEAFARAVFDFVRSRVAFVREPGEVFTSPSYTLAVRAGDCDDHARAVYALLRAGGLPARLAFLFQDARRGPTHVVAQAYAGGAWRWLETTIAADFGEHPAAAGRRLGLLDARQDVTTGGERIMDEKSLPPAAPSALDTRTQEERDAEALAALGFVGPHAVASFQATRPELVRDGIIGPRTRAALVSALNGAGMGELAIGYLGAAGGTSLTPDLSSGFFRGVRAMAERMRAKGATIDGDDLLAVWNAESGIKASVPNAAGASYYGLNQMGTTQLRAAGFTGTPREYMALSAEEQLPFVERYYTNATGGRLDLLKDSAHLYVANFLPAYLPRVVADPSFVLADRDNDPHGFYRWNTSLDTDGDGTIVLADMKRAIGRAQSAPRWLEARRRYFAESGAPEVSASKVGVVVGLLVAMGAAAWWVSRA